MQGEGRVVKFAPTCRGELKVNLREYTVFLGIDTPKSEAQSARRL